MDKLYISKQKINEIMVKKKIKTQTELAKLMGITKNQLSVILSGNFSPIKSNIRLLCEILDVNLDEIIEYKYKTSEQLNKYCIAEKKEKYDLKTITDDYLDLKEIDFYDVLNLKQEEYVDISEIKPLRGYNVVELFAGAGGLACGLEEAGFNSVGLVENNKYCCQTLRANRPKWNVIEGDVVNIAERGIRNFIPDINIDLLSGGYPCQAFSYSGKKLGLSDVRGTMFYYYAAILKDLKPKMFLAENVRGLVSHDGGKTLETMKNVFEEIGYKVEHRVLKALDYGVAQKRERVIIVGIRNDFCDIKYYPPRKFLYKPTLRDALKNVPKSIGAKYPESKRKVLDLVPPGGYWRDLDEEIAKQYMGKSYYSTGGRTGMARRISWDEACLTLTCSPAQKQTERCHPDETRPFTIREYARIQSFDDNWQFCGSMAEQYKQIGNAVPVNLAKAVGLSIINTLNKMELK